ncbi:DnaJ like chaperone protein [uncultured Gammaproteobacteria bacterium]
MMSIWGKILGGAAGFAMGGPIGAIIGAAAGHAVDKFSHAPPEDGGDGEPHGRGKDGTKSIAFTIAVIVLAAKMAKADGSVSRAEIEIFKRVFRVPPEELRSVGKLFDQARTDSVGFQPYARQVARMFRHRRAVLEELLEGLFRIAEADGVLQQSELEYLHQVARIFGFSDQDFHRICAAHAGRFGDSGEPDPYEILGVARTLGDDELKVAYRRLLREHHPDRLIAQGLPQEFIVIATDKMAGINAAYDQIKAERGIN